MKPVSLIRRSLGIACSALLLTGLLSAPVSAASSNSLVTAGDTAVVTADILNIRTGPGTQYSSTGALTEGYAVKVISTQDGWGRIDAGWIDLDYTRSTKKANGSVLRSGYVTADRLNVRIGPGLNYQTCGALTNGYRVDILEYSNGWGRIDSGWIYLDYISSSPSSTNAVHGSRVKVIANQLNIRQGAGTGYSRSGSYGYGDLVELLETKGNWGRTNRGWICLDYTTYPNGTAGGQAYRSITAGSLVQVTADSLLIRIGAGRNYQSCGALTEGFREKILEVDGSWGRIDSGWICLDYVRLV